MFSVVYYLIFAKSSQHINKKVQKSCVQGKVDILLLDFGIDLISSAL